MNTKMLISTLICFTLFSSFISCSWLEKDPMAPQPTPSSTADQATQSNPQAEPIAGGTLVLSLGIGPPIHFNPALLSGSIVTIPGSQIFASPLRYDENWNPQPYLAKSWEVSDDGLSVTLHLVENATFHDGVPITSEDVAFSLLTVQQYHPFKSMFAPVTAVETPDPYTVVIQLSRPHPAILLAMSPPCLPILPKHIYGDGQDILTHPANLVPVGSGPFKFVSYEQDKRIILEKNEDFFIPGRPFLDRLEIWLDLDPISQAVDLERQVSHMTTVYTDYPSLEKLGESGNMVITRQGYEGLGPLNWLAFNLLREPVSDVRVRQAIAHAIDMDFIIDYMNKGLSQRAYGPIVPDSPFYDPDIPRYSYDPEKAVDLLDQAGYPITENGFRFSLTLDYLPLVPSQQRDTAYLIKKNLKDIGIEVIIRDSGSFPDWAYRISHWDFDMTLDAVYNWGDPIIGVHRTYITENIKKGVIWSNTQNYRNPVVDELLSEAATEMDFEKRKQLYQEFQQIIVEDLPVIPINVFPYHTVYNINLGNPPLTIWGVHSPLDEVYWKQPIEKNYIDPPAISDTDEVDPLVLLGRDAIQLLENQDFYSARDYLSDPQNGFLDLGKPGLHVFGVTLDGVVFLDNSGQLYSGMNLSDLLDSNGNLVLPNLIDAAQTRSLEPLVLEGILPHPTSGKISPVNVWCGLLTDEEVVCALIWSDEGISQ